MPDLKRFSRFFTAMILLLSAPSVLSLAAAPETDTTSADKGALCQLGLAEASDPSPIRDARNEVLKLKNFVSSKVLGQEELVNSLMIALLVNGHVLIVSYPGAAKTRSVEKLAAGSEGKFSKIQFTPDMMPSDITGSAILNTETHKFDFHPGPIFGNFILADEINRASPRTQSAMLEAMESGQVTTTTGETFKLSKPYLVLATENPLAEEEGTYKLPHAQMDRFLFSLNIDYPSAEIEKAILHLTHQERLAANAGIPEVVNKISLDDIIQAQRQVEEIAVPSDVEDYIVNLVASSRPKDHHFPVEMIDVIQVGVSPRATHSLEAAAKAHAYLENRRAVEMQDVDAVAHNILRHRLILKKQSEYDSITPDYVIDQLIANLRKHHS